MKIVSDQLIAELDVLSESMEEPTFDNVASFFHENTKIRNVPTLEGIPNSIYSSSDVPLGNRSTIRFGRAIKVGLEVGRRAPISHDLGKVFRERRSMRGPSGKTLDLNMLSRLLVESFGKSGETGAEGTHLRVYPSGGALYPLEIFLLARDVEALPFGFYYFDALNEDLSFLDGSVSEDQLSFVFCGQEIAANAKVVVIYASCFGRSILKYGPRGYRYALLEAGHAAQNLSLLCGDLGYHHCNSGGFMDSELNSFLRLDGLNEGAVYLSMIA